MQESPKENNRRGAAMFIAAAVMLAIGIAGIVVLLTKAQNACRRSAAFYRLTCTAREAIGQMSAELRHAGNVSVSNDGMTMTFQLPIRLTMAQVQTHVAHGGAPPPAPKTEWTPKDVNQDGRIDENDADIRDSLGRVFWGAKESVGDVWGNYVCYQFQHLDSNGNGVADIDDCIDESVIRMDINNNGRADDVFLPGEVVRFSTTEGRPGGHPEEHMTSLYAPLINGRSWVIVKWDKAANRVAPPNEQDVDGDGEPDGPIFREMVWWPSKPLDHPLRKPLDCGPGRWDVWHDCPRIQYRRPTIVSIDMWQLRVTVDGRHFLHHVRAAADCAQL